jgi:hypothetical protein
VLSWVPTGSGLWSGEIAKHGHEIASHGAITVASRS